MSEQEKYTIDEFATRIKEKYPQYKDIDNNELVDKITTKYPEYNESIIKKKDGSVQESISESERSSSVGEGFRTVMERSPEGEAVQETAFADIDPEVFKVDMEATAASQKQQKAKREEQYNKIAQDVKPFIEESKNYVDTELDKIRTNQNYYTGAQIDEQIGDYPPVPNAFLRTKQVDRYKTSQRLLKDVEKFIESPTDEGLQSFWKGLSNKNTVDLLTLGYSEMFDEMSVADAAQKSRDGRELTPDETVLLTTKYILNELQANKDMPSSYNIGAGLAEMVPYVAQIALTKGIGSGVTNSAKGLAKNQLGKIIAKYGIADLAGAAASAPFTGIMWESVAQKRTGELALDDKGNIVAVKGTEESPREAIAKAWTNTAIELFTERFVGEKLSNLKNIGKSAQKTLSTPEKLTGFNKAVSQFRKQANWDGLMSEWGEEQISAIGQAITTGDASIQDLLDVKNQFEMFATIALANGAFKANEIPGYIKKGMQNNKYDNAKKSLDIIEDQELKNQVIKDVDNSKNVDQLQENLKDRGYEQLDPVQQKVILDFVEAKLEKDVIDGMSIQEEEDAAAQEQEQAVKEMEIQKAEAAKMEKVEPKKAEIPSQKPVEAPKEEITPPKVKEPTVQEKVPEKPLKEDLKGKVYERPEMENPVHRAVVNGEEVFVQRMEGMSPSETAWYQVKKTKDGGWTTVKEGGVTEFPTGYTKAEAIQTIKTKSDEKIRMQKEGEGKKPVETKAEETYRKGQKDEILTKAEEDAEKMGTLRKESESQKPEVREKGEPIRSVYSEYRADKIGKAIQKVGDIRKKKPEKLIQEAQSVEELDFLLSNNKVSFTPEFNKKKAALREGDLIEDTGRIKDISLQMVADKAPIVEQQLKKDLGEDKFNELREKKQEVIARMAERAARIAGAKFAIGEDGKRPDVVNELVGFVKDLIELGSINIELGTRSAVDKLKKIIGGQDPEIMKNITDNEEALLSALEEEGFVEPPAAEEMKEEIPPKEEVPPTKPPEGTEEEYPVPKGQKRRRVAERILQDPNISEDIKKGLSEDAKNYVPVSNETTEHEAQAIIDTKFTATGSHDQSIKAITSTNNAIPPRIRVVMAGKVIDSLNKQMAEAEDPEAKTQFQNDAIKVAEFVTEYGTKLGQGIQAFNIWAKINTETVVTKFNNDMEKIRGEKLNKDEERNLRNLSKKVRDARAGFQKNKAIQDMLAYQMRLKGIKWNDVGMAVWYAHVLSGYSTQVLNIMANVAETMGEVFTSMVYKPKTAPWLLKGLFDGYGRGLLEAWTTLKTGYAPVKSIKYDVTKDAPGVLEAYQGFKMFKRRWNPFTFHKYVARAMSAADTFFYHGLKGMRSYELSRMGVDGKGLSLSEVNNQVNEKLGNTKERKAKVQKQLEVESQERYTELRLEKDQIEKDLKASKDPKVVEEIQRELKRINKELDAAKKKGEKVYKKGSIEYKRRYLELMEESIPDEVIEDANNIASRGTFNYDTEGRLGMVTDTVAALSNKPGLKAMKFVVPFTRIVSNVANRYLDWTPYGFVRGLKGGIGYKPRSEWGRSKYSREYTREEKVKEYIKASAGTLAAVTLLMLSKGSDDEDDQQGPFEITANGTGDYRKNYNLKETGWQQYSIRIGDKWYSYANTPLAIPMQVIGTLNDMKKYRGEKLSDKSFSDKAGIALWNTFRYFTDLTFLQGLSEFLTSFNEDDPQKVGKYFERFATGAAKGFIIPNLFTQVSRQVQSWMDLPIKEASEMWEKFYRDVPIARKGLTDMVNGLGEPVVPDTDRYISQVESDPIWEIIVKNNAWIGKPPKSIRVYDLETGEDREVNNDEYFAYCKLRGQKLKQFITGNYDKLNSLEKDAFQEEMSDFKKRANKEAKVELLLGKVSFGLSEIKKRDPKAFEALKQFKGFHVPAPSQSVYIGREERYMNPEELDEYRLITLDNYIKEASKVTGSYDVDKMQKMADQEIVVGQETTTRLKLQLEIAWAKASSRAYAEMYKKIRKSESEK